MEIDYPKTRMDNFFAKAAGSELADDSMEPITDREYWINEMAAKIAQGGGGGCGGVDIFTWGDDYTILEASWNDVMSSIRAGRLPMIGKIDDTGFSLFSIIYATADDGYYDIQVDTATGQLTYYTASTPDANLQLLQG